jgi:endonuclease/exonuclease/phosphatase family metal-dependent hydrolase
MLNRAHWIMLQELPGGDLGICNIYAPNNPQERCQLWEALIQELPATCRWILAGDFNMVLARQDKTNKCGCLLPQYELVIYSTTWTPWS